MFRIHCDSRLQVFKCGWLSAAAMQHYQCALCFVYVTDVAATICRLAACPLFVLLPPERKRAAAEAAGSAVKGSEAKEGRLTGKQWFMQQLAAGEGWAVASEG